MLEVALLVVASVLALAGAAWAARVADDGPAATARGTRHVRDDAVVAAVASVLLFVVVLVGHRRSGAVTHTRAWSAGACAFGALATMASRAWRDRSAASPLSARIGERAIVIMALGILTVLGASAAQALSDPQHLGAQIPEMVVAFTVGCAALESEGAFVLVAAAAMVLASYLLRRERQRAAGAVSPTRARSGSSCFQLAASSALRGAG